AEGAAPALFGQIRYNSNVPIYVAPVLPDPFNFVDAVNVPRGVPVISNTVAISGISSAPIRVQGGEYSIDGGPFTSAPGTIANAQPLARRLHRRGQDAHAACGKRLHVYSDPQLLQRDVLQHPGRRRQLECEPRGRGQSTDLGAAACAGRL